MMPRWLRLILICLAIAGVTSLMFWCANLTLYHYWAADVSNVNKERLKWYANLYLAATGSLFVADLLLGIPLARTIWPERRASGFPVIADARGSDADDA